MSMNSVRLRPSKKASVSQRKIERRSVISEYWIRPPTNELDVVDKGDALEIKACSKDVAAWWLGTLRAMYPQDSYSGEGEHLKMHPELGVTLKLNRNDGTLTIKGKKHFQWFKENFDQVLEAGDKDFKAIADFSKVIDGFLKIDDGYTVAELLEHLPTSGAVRHGPSYVYRLWRGLLEQWLAGENKVYIISPLLDAKRLADVILILAKHKRSRSRVQLYTTHRCDGENKFPKVFKHAKEMVKELKNPTNQKNRLIVDERLNLGLEKLEPKFGSFHCKLIAAANDQYTEVLLTSASFHSMHFHFDHADMVLFMRIPTADFMNNYLEPLGLAPRYEPGSAPVLSGHSRSDDSTL